MDKLKHLQTVLLSMMKDIDRICRENNIDYYLEGGSAIGAVRHKGFIPWDDDIDIIMDHVNYDKFLNVCKSSLDKNKYYIQEALVDWPLPYSKIRLNGTQLVEHCMVEHGSHNGIYIDVFKMDNVSSISIIRFWQYLCSKLFLAYLLAENGYKTRSKQKKFIMFFSSVLKIKIVKSFIYNQTIMYNNKDTGFYGFYYSVRKWRSGTFKRDVFGKPYYTSFEDTFLPLPQKYDKFLMQEFGDYMKIPPVQEQKVRHLISVNFGRY